MNRGFVPHWTVCCTQQPRSFEARSEKSSLLLCMLCRTHGRTTAASCQTWVGMPPTHPAALHLYHAPHPAAVAAAMTDMRTWGHQLLPGTALAGNTPWGTLLQRMAWQASVSPALATSQSRHPAVDSQWW